VVNWLTPGAIVLVTVPADMRLWSAHDIGLLHRRRYDRAMLERTWAGLPVQVMALTHFCARLYPFARLRSAFRRVVPRRTQTNGWSMRVPAGPINRVLKRTFEGESRVLCNLAGGRSRQGYSYGVSLMALLRRVDDDASRSSVGGGRG
jgi:hypothetical protein